MDGSYRRRIFRLDAGWVPSQACEIRTNEMNANLVARVLDHIKRQPHQPVTFLDLADAFPADFRDGTRSLRLHQDQTIVVWHCVTDAAIQAIEELMAAELVIVTASPQVKWLYV